LFSVYCFVLNKTLLFYHTGFSISFRKLYFSDSELTSLNVLALRMCMSLYLNSISATPIITTIIANTTNPAEIYVIIRSIPVSPQPLLLLFPSKISANDVK